MVRAKSTRIRRAREDFIFDIINTVICVLLLVTFAYPLYNILIVSVSDSNAVYNGLVTWRPVDFSMNGYREVFNNQSIWIGYRNSLIYTVVGVLISMFLTTTVSYAISRKEFMIRGLIMRMMTFTMYFSGGLIPTYLLIRDMHMLHTIWPVLLLGSVSVMNVIIMRTSFMTSIPDELREAAFLDGCSDTRFLITVVLPLSKAVLAVIILYYGIGYWNSYFNAMIYLNDSDAYPLQLVLRQILFQSQVDITDLTDELALSKLKLQESIKYCVIVVASLPPMLAYPVVQKYFIHGVMIGSIKG